MHRRIWIWSVVLSLLIVFITGAGAASAVELDRANSLRVNAIEGDSEYAQDIIQAEVVIDLYQIAAAQAVEGADLYSYIFAAPYTGITVGDIPVSQINLEGVSLSNQQWQNLAQQAAAIAIGSQTPLVSGVSVGSILPDLPAGLYLVIARGSGITAYQQTERNDQGADVMVTSAQSERYIYSFSPTVVSLPTKDARIDENGNIITNEDGIPVIGSGDEYGDWVYDATVSLKPDVSPRYGGVKITKIIDKFPAAEGEKPAEEVTFVFRITAQASAGSPFADDADYTYENVLAVAFNGTTGLSNTAYDYGIRAGAEVTVEEIYTGSRYRKGDLIAPMSAVIVADQGNELEFTAYNMLTDSGNSGHGIQNYFVNVESDNDENSYWDVQQQTAN